MVCCAVSNKNKLKVHNKTKQLKQQKATETETEKWLLMVGVQLFTPVVGGVPEYKLGYPWIIPLNTSGEEALTTASGSMFQSRTVRGKRINSHMMTVRCGKPESFLPTWVQDATWCLRALESQPGYSESCKTCTTYCSTGRTCFQFLLHFGPFYSVFVIAS